MTKAERRALGLCADCNNKAVHGCRCGPCVEKHWMRSERARGAPARPVGRPRACMSCIDGKRCATCAERNRVRTREREARLKAQGRRWV